MLLLWAATVLSGARIGHELAGVPRRAVVRIPHDSGRAAQDDLVSARRCPSRECAVGWAVRLEERRVGRMRRPDQCPAIPPSTDSVLPVT